MESEYMAASVMGHAFLGMRDLLGELEVAFVQPTELRVDNQYALVQLEGEKALSKAKHINDELRVLVGLH
ncbi:hypothetical protein PC112_g9273 [Phytophthora cactorum]|nr:hypothetical protein PC112_g9273 [Phytophthora cactorum]